MRQFLRLPHKHKNEDQPSHFPKPPSLSKHFNTWNTSILPIFEHFRTTFRSLFPHFQITEDITQPTKIMTYIIFEMPLKVTSKFITTSIDNQPISNLTHNDDALFQTISFRIQNYNPQQNQITAPTHNTVQNIFMRPTTRSIRGPCYYS